MIELANLEKDDHSKWGQRDNMGKQECLPSFLRAKINVHINQTLINIMTIFNFVDSYDNFKIVTPHSSPDLAKIIILTGLFLLLVNINRTKV